jgi:hypothetical protein
VGVSELDPLNSPQTELSRLLIVVDPLQR